MDELEEKLNAVLGNPQMMQQIMAMAQSMGTNTDTSTDSSPAMPPIDLGMLQKLSGFAQHSGIDKNQQSLLQALRPYLSRERISKLEKAMRAAKIAKFATGLVGSGGLQIPSGR